MAEDEVLEPIEGTSPPKSVNSTRRINGRFYLAGEGNKPSPVMFVAAAALEEEVSHEVKLRYGKTMPQKPAFLKGPAGSIFKELLEKTGFKKEDWFYTALCRWLLPREERMRPKKPAINHGLPALLSEVAEVHPKFIICLGKSAFELFVKDIKGSVADLAGSWHHSPEHMARVYVMEDLTKLVTKPEFYERFKQDLTEIKKMLDETRGIKVPKIPLNYETIRTKDDLIELVARLKAMGAKVLSIDCEWHGQNHIVGQLRSLQICWAPGCAAYIRFMDDKLNYVFDCSYEEAGAVLAEHLDDPEVKYIGHHLAADLPWLHHVLKLQWYNKGIFDTEFTQQCVDEYEKLGLERLSIKFTDLGRYDMDLYRWWKDSKNREFNKGGYGFIPDHILIPYGCADVDVVMRAWPQLRAQMDKQEGLSAYYDKLFNPFVTNFFTSYAVHGLPMNRAKMDELRDLFQWARREMTIEFQILMTREAEHALMFKMSKLGTEGIIAAAEIVDAVREHETGQAMELLKAAVGVGKLVEYMPFLEHLLIAPTFNPNSTEQVRRWLFTIKGFTPIKSTNQKEKGLPAMSWDKVMSYPEAKQKEFTPSTDGQTLEILKSQNSDKTLEKLLQLKAVSTVCKNFLKPSTVDDDGEVIKENGLHSWVATDDRVHGQMSATETGRPRSWQPNILNWPKWINKKISGGIKTIVELRHKEEKLPKRFERYLTESIPSIRSCVESIDGWCIVESDYQTAELRGQAYHADCPDMINLITKPDLNFVKIRPDATTIKDCVVRVGYPSYIPESRREDKWLMAYGAEGVVKQTFSDEDVLLDKDGKPVHTKQDLHWSLAEMVHKTPRENLSKDKDRDAAKVGNFSSAYGASPATLERKIESDTGIKPEEGTGQAILDALRARQPKATEWLESMELIPVDPGKYQALSGRIRHFYTHPDNVAGLSARTRDGQLSAMGRECRNFPMQESVGATAARAGNWLMDFGIKNGLQGFILTILYDSVVTMCPFEERFIWADAHKLFMYLKNGWNTPNNILRYPIDTDFNMAWSWKPTKEEAEKLADVNYKPTPEHLQAVHEWLKNRIELYEENEELSLL